MKNQTLSSSHTYHTIVIGAGIAGCCVAHFLQKKGVDVLVLDRSDIPASGGSGAAGAFVSSKIGKGSALQQITNEAYLFAKEFYSQNFPEYFHQTGVVRIPKDEADAKKFLEYEVFNDTSYQKLSKQELQELGITGDDSFFYKEAGVCDAPELCSAILSTLPFEQYAVEKLIKNDEYWQIGKYKTKNIVLATGYQNNLLDMQYMGVKGTWGSRGDYRSNLDLDISMHQSISVSANIKGVIKIGATHVKSKEPCMVCDGEPLKSLFQKASTMVDTNDFELIETYCGMRAGSKDYFPLLGSIIDVPEMFRLYPRIATGIKIKEPIVKIENIFVCNGVGGRGFVFAPLLGKMLAEYIVDNKTIDKRIDPDRLFLKWCRKNKTLKR